MFTSQRGLTIIFGCIIYMEIIKLDDNKVEKIASNRNFQIQLRLVGWWPVAGSSLVLGAFFILNFMLSRQTGANNLIYTRRVIETIAPLAFALQAAFLLGPDNEPTMELLLSYPKSLPKIFFERLLLVGGMHAAVALIATLVFAATWQAEGLGLALIRWLTAGIALGGIAVFTTQLTRQGVFGTLVTTLMWAASLFGGDKLLTAWPWFWPLQVYLQPDNVSVLTYWLNRVSILAIGMGLTLLAVSFLKDEDRLLGEPVRRREKVCHEDHPANISHRPHRIPLRAPSWRPGGYHAPDRVGPGGRHPDWAAG